MRSLKVEFLPRRRVSPWLWRGLTAALLVLAAQQGWEAWQLRRQVVAMEVSEARLSAKIDDLKRAHEEARARASLKPPYYRDALAVAKTAAFPLQRVLGAIESAQVKGVRVTGIDIDAVSGAVRVELDLTVQEGLLQFLEAINEGEPQPRWMLVEAKTATSTGGTSTAIIASQWGDPDR